MYFSLYPSCFISQAKYQGNLLAYIRKYVLSFYIIAPFYKYFLHNLFALISVWISQMYAKLFFLYIITPLISLPIHLPLGYLSLVIHNTFLLFPENSFVLNGTSITQRCSELSPSYYSSVTLFASDLGTPSSILQNLL
jgi:hypothetical protein